MKINNLISSICLFCTLYHLVEPRKIKQNNVTFNYQGTAKINWKLRLTSDQFYIYDKENKKHLLGAVSKLTKDTFKKYFGDRAVPKIVKTEFQITISKLQYADNSYRFAVGTQDAKRLVVLGPPKDCGAALPDKITLNEGESIHENIVMCGNPRPTVSWELQANRRKEEGLRGTLVGDLKYRYIFKTPPITSSLCGTYFIVTVKGSTSKEFKILILVKARITNLQYIDTGDSNCPMVKWKRIEYSDNCLYTIDVVYKDANQQNVTSVRLPRPDDGYASCRNKNGKYVEVRLETKTLKNVAISQLTSGNVKLVKASSLISDDDDESIETKDVIIIGLGCVILVLIIIVAIMVRRLYCNGKKKKADISRIFSVNNQYENTRDLTNVINKNATLGLDTVENSTYTELEVNTAIEDNQYEAINTRRKKFEESQKRGYEVSPNARKKKFEESLRRGYEVYEPEE